jgi:hypothetical protein
MAKLTLNDIVSGYGTAALYNANNTLIEAAIENTISRDGTSPNTMSAPLDMNSHAINNVSDGVLSTDAATVQQLNDIALVTGTTIPAQTGNANKVLHTDGSVTGWIQPQLVVNSNTPAGNIAATTIQTAINELDTDKVNLTGANTITGDNTHSGANTFSGINTFSTINNFTAGVGPSYIQNLGLTASVSAKALTVALKTKALADATSTNKVELSFRNATATTGDYVVRSVTAALSVVLPSGGTLGFTAAEIGRIYIYAIDNAGTVELALSKKSIFEDGKTYNTTAIGTGSDSDNVLYSTSARTAVAVRLIGRLDITTGAVAGEWDNEDARICVWTSGHTKAVGVLATASGSSSSSFSGATATFATAVDAEIGDLVLCTYTMEATRNGADFSALIGLGIVSGTAVLESTGIANGATRRTIQFDGPTIYAAGYIYKSETFIAKVATAGTITTFGHSLTASYGTTPTNQKSHISVQIIRPNV